MRGDFLLGVLIVALSGVLALMWLGADGSALVGQWQPPAPIAPRLDGLAVAATEAQPPSARDLGDVLARPVFSLSRRPATTPVAAKPAAPADRIDDVRLIGLISPDRGAGGAAIAMLDGKVMRVTIGGVIADWTLTAIDDGEVELSRAGETRRLALVRAKALHAAPSEQRRKATQGKVEPAPESAAQRSETMKERIQREYRERIAARNALRVQNGLPPLPEN